MNDYPPLLYIAGPRRIVLNDVETNTPRTTFQSEQQYVSTVNCVSDLISALTVDNALITVMSKNFEGLNNKVEQWYGTKVRPKMNTLFMTYLTYLTLSLMPV